MADFCKQCSVLIFGEDFRELAGITSSEDQERGFYAVTLCEGCGPILVDSDGACLSVDCGGDHRKHG